MNFIQAVSVSLDHLVEAIERKPNKKGVKIDGVTNSVGEIVINGVEYQIQLRLEENKNSWINENNVEYISIDADKVII